MKLSKNNTQSKAKRTRLTAELRHQQLVEIALSVAANKGLGQLRHSDIAEQADVALSTIFFYFPTVKQLNNVVIDELEKFIDLVSVKNLIDKIDGEDPLQIIDMQMDLIEQTEQKTNININVYNSIYLQWSCSINSPYWQRHNNLKNKQLDLLKKVLIKAKNCNVFNDSIDMDVAAAMFTAVYNLLIIMRLTGESEDVMKEVRLSLKNHLLK